MERAQDLIDEVREVQGTVELILRDTLTDYRGRELAREKSRLRKDIIILVLILSLVGSFIYYQWSFKRFLESSTFETVTIDAAQDGGGVNVIGGGDVANGSTSEGSNQ